MNCPYCCEEVSDAAIVCKYCHRDWAILVPTLNRISELSRRVEQLEAHQAKQGDAVQARVDPQEEHQSLGKLAAILIATSLSCFGCWLNGSTIGTALPYVLAFACVAGGAFAVGTRKALDYSIYIGAVGCVLLLAIAIGVKLKSPPTEPGDLLFYGSLICAFIGGAFVRSHGTGFRTPSLIAPHAGNPFVTSETVQKIIQNFAGALITLLFGLLAGHSNIGKAG
jgi:hypothetical protein